MMRWLSAVVLAACASAAPTCAGDKNVTFTKPWGANSWLVDYNVSVAPARRTSGPLAAAPARALRGGLSTFSANAPANFWGMRLCWGMRSITGHAFLRAVVTRGPGAEARARSTVDHALTTFRPPPPSAHVAGPLPQRPPAARRGRRGELEAAQGRRLLRESSGARPRARCAAPPDPARRIAPPSPQCLDNCRAATSSAIEYDVVGVQDSVTNSGAHITVYFGANAKAQVAKYCA